VINETLAVHFKKNSAQPQKIIRKYISRNSAEKIWLAEKRAVFKKIGRGSSMDSSSLDGKQFDGM